MAAQINFARREKTLYGYIRQNFGKRCWIEAIMETILAYYMSKGGSLYLFGHGIGHYLKWTKYKSEGHKRPFLCPPFDQNNALQVASSIHTLILDVDGNVWAFGDGHNGQLGSGKIKELSVPTKIKMTQIAISVCAGLQHSLILLQNRWIQSTGSNSSGQIGHNNLPKSLTPKTIEQLKKYKITQICAGSFYSAALTENGVLFCFGDNAEGQCGIGRKKKKIKIPTKVALNEKIAFIDCGRVHSLLITSNGLMYSFGDGEYGTLGHGNKKKKYSPTLIDSVKDVQMTTCAAGGEHSLCIDQKGRIWSFGRNNNRQCGFVSLMRELWKPKIIEWFASKNIKAKECAAGSCISSVISVNGDLYVFGYNDGFQLAVNDTESYLMPCKSTLPQNVFVEAVSMKSHYTAVLCT